MAKFQIKCSCIKCKRETTTSQLTRNHLNKCPEILEKRTRVAWNKGLTKDSDSRLSYGEKISKALTGKPGRKHTEENKMNLSEKARARGFGGVTQSRWINYNGVMLGSSYELKVAISLDENHIIWEKPRKFNYIDPFGKVRTYTPDFYLPDYDVYLDPKNDFLINNINPSLGFKDTEKINLVANQNNIKIYIVDKNNLDWINIERIMSS